MNEIKTQILKCFYDLQCSEDSGDFNDDETPTIRYSLLERELNLSRDRLRPNVIELRNDGVIELGPTVDVDYMPSGSGYHLTTKGAELVKSLFFREEVLESGNEKVQ